jgi:nitrate reductase beta subunit
VSACPYSKVFFNWATGKAEKCTYCAPLTGQGEQAVCFRNCPTGVFVSGPVLYDADRIHEVAAGEHGGGIDAIRELILDPNESSVAAAARRNGIPERSLEEATESPVYSSIVDWKIAHPLHPEFRTLPMFFYIPPVGPILRGGQETGERLSDSPAEVLKERHSDSEMLSQLFSAERPSEIELSLKRLLAIRAHRVALSGEGQDTKVAERWLTEAGLDAGDADRIAEAFKIGSVLERGTEFED